jgi:DNA-binding IclR family transcriptional regulator
MEIVRRRGYATDHEENEPGVACIGAPVLNEAGVSVAAMSVSGPSMRILKQEREIGNALAAVCKEMSRQIGFSGQRSSTAIAQRAAAGKRANG